MSDAADNIIYKVQVLFTGHGLRQNFAQDSRQALARRNSYILIYTFVCECCLLF